jgi:hypothetical protein
LYSGAGPTFVSRVPLFTGGRVGLESEIHQNQVHVHKAAFELIHQLTLRLRRNTLALADRGGTNGIKSQSSQQAS